MPRQQILDSRGNPIRSLDRGTRRIIRSRYDAASESNDTKRWWANADNLSARSANSPEVREKLRKRARYEAANGSYPAAIARTLAYDLIGTGPRLQVTTSDEGFNADVEARWREWVAAVRLPEKLRVMRRARAVDGESFGLLETNRNLQTPSKLDLRVIEADLVCDPFGFSPDPTSVDGIRLDRYGNPAAYYVMRQHPGDDMQIAGFGEYTTVPARLMIHWFRPDRPMQYRGVPEFTPALDLFAKLRRYTLAVIAAAEIAADYSAVLESDLLPNPNGEESEAIPAGEAFEVERGMMVTLPNGQKLKQLAAEQPTTTFEMFDVRILKQVCVALGIPYFVATGDYADVNFSSGRLGKEGYYRDIDVERWQISDIGLDHLFPAWFEDMATRGAISYEAPGSIPHRWLWPGFPYFDPEAEAKAIAIQLQNGLTTFTDQCHSQGIDRAERVRTMVEDRDLLESNGFPSPYFNRSSESQPSQAAASHQSRLPSSNGRY
jgi:lambda family phage portal protein